MTAVGGSRPAARDELSSTHTVARRADGHYDETGAAVVVSTGVLARRLRTIVVGRQTSRSFISRGADRRKEDIANRAAPARHERENIAQAT